MEAPIWCVKKNGGPERRVQSRAGQSRGPVPSLCCQVLLPKLMNSSDHSSKTHVESHCVHRSILRKVLVRQWKRGVQGEE